MCVRFPLRFVFFVALAIRFRGFIIEVAGIGSTFRPYLKKERPKDLMSVRKLKLPHKMLRNNGS